MIERISVIFRSSIPVSLVESLVSERNPAVIRQAAWRVFTRIQNSIIPARTKNIHDMEYPPTKETVASGARPKIATMSVMAVGRLFVQPNFSRIRSQVGWKYSSISVSSMAEKISENMRTPDWSGWKGTTSGSVG